MSQLISVQQRSEQPDEAGNWQAIVRINNGPENHSRQPILRDHPPDEVLALELGPNVGLGERSG